MKKGNELLTIGALGIVAYLAYKLFSGDSSGFSGGSGFISPGTREKDKYSSGNLAHRILTTNAFVTTSPMGTTLYQYPQYGIIRNYPSATKAGLNFLPPPGIPYYGPSLGSSKRPILYAIQKGIPLQEVVNQRVAKQQNAYNKPGGM